MFIVFYAFILLFLIFIMLKKNRTAATLISSFCIIFIIFKPKLCINACIKGALMFFYKVFPSIFIFSVICNILLNAGGVEDYSKLFGKILCKPLKLPQKCSFAVIISFLCGYPLGAKYSCDMYKDGIIDYDTCERLINIASNASPLFIIGTIGTSMLNNTKLAYILLFSHYVSCFIMALLIKPKNYTYNDYNVNSVTLSKKTNKNLLKNSIENSLNTCFCVGGFVVIFSVISAALNDSTLFYYITFNLSNILKVPTKVLEGIIVGIIEITNGCNIISAANCNIYYKLIPIAFLISFSGFSIILQVSSFISEYDFSLKKYLRRKIIQGIICSLILVIIFKILSLNNCTYLLNLQYKI